MQQGVRHSRIPLADLWQPTDRRSKEATASDELPPMPYLTPPLPVLDTWRLALCHKPSPQERQLALDVRMLADKVAPHTVRSP